jgi:hypothetical protein
MSGFCSLHLLLALDKLRSLHLSLDRTIRSIPHIIVKCDLCARWYTLLTSRPPEAC